MNDIFETFQDFGWRIGLRHDLLPRFERECVELRACAVRLDIATMSSQNKPRKPVRMVGLKYRGETYTETLGELDHCGQAGVVGGGGVVLLEIFGRELQT